MAAGSAITRDFVFALCANWQISGKKLFLQ